MTEEIRTDNTKTLQNALKRIAELEKENEKLKFNLDYAKAVMRELLDNSNEYARQNAEDFIAKKMTENTPEEVWKAKKRIAYEWFDAYKPPEIGILDGEKVYPKSQLLRAYTLGYEDALRAKN